MRLIVKGISISITHMAHDYILIEPDCDCPAGAATVFLRVDQAEHRWNVHLSGGISSKSRRVAVALGK